MRIAPHLPKELLLKFEGVSYLVRPEIGYTGKKAGAMPVLAAKNGFKQLYSNDILSVYRQLREAEKDVYSSLSLNQPLVKANLVPANVMAVIIRNFHDDVVLNKFVWTELLYLQNKENETVYELPKNKNAVMYRNWAHSDGKADVSGAIAFPVRWKEEEAEVMFGGSFAIESILESFGPPEDAHLLHYDKNVLKDLKGLSALSWDFRINNRPLSSRPRLDLYKNINADGDSGGALLGSELSADEIVRAFKPEELKIETIEMSDSQKRLAELEHELVAYKKSYAGLGERIGNMEKIIAELKGTKPE